MLNFEKLQTMRNVTVGEVIEMLKQFPEDITVICKNNDHWFVHVDDDEKIIYFDDLSREFTYRTQGHVTAADLEGIW